MYMQAADTRQEKYARLMTPMVRKTLMSHALRLSKHRQDAEDLLIEAELRAFRSIDGYDETRSFQNWCMRILDRLYLDLKRARTCRIQASQLTDWVGDESSIEIEFPDPDVDIMADVLRRDRSETLLSIVERLEDTHSRLLKMDLDEMPYVDIAELDRCPVGTVRSRVFRARQALKKLADGCPNLHDLF
jgi:RNA polymerase sigma-70 factor, ECF subfamily